LPIIWSILSLVIVAVLSKCAVPICVALSETRNPLTS
jgi:hypothetical protein